MSRNRSLLLLIVTIASFTLFAVSVAAAREARQGPDDGPDPGDVTLEQEAEQEKAATDAPATHPSFLWATDAVTAPLFIGVDSVSVPAYHVDVETNAFYTAFVGAEVWGAAYDPTVEKVFFNDGATLYEWPVSGGAPVMTGIITDGLGNSLNAVGLAYFDGFLYSSRNIANEAIYRINPQSLVATPYIDYVDADYDFGGIAFDPNTGALYGTNDAATPHGRGLFEINGGGTATMIAPYPDGQTDIDGLAVSDDGKAYLVPDEPGLIYVFDFDVMTYTTPLNNPWTSSLIFSGGAWIHDGDPGVVLTKTVGLDPGVCAAEQEVWVPSGTDVTYCYAVTNNSPYTYSSHDLEDDRLGTLLADFPFALGPGASVWLTQTINITQTTVNQATWTLSDFTRYRVDDSAPYSFQDISGTGTPLGLVDDGEANVTMPFSFNFFDASSNQLRIGNNGGILFDATSDDIPFSNGPLPTTTFEMGILPFWDDIDSDTGDVYYQTLGTAPDRMFVVQWHDRPHFPNSADHVTFQAILYEGSNEILFQYQDVNFSNAAWDNGASATIGLQQSSTQARQYTTNQASLSDGRAIRYTPVSVSAGDSARVYVEPRAGVDPPSLSSNQVSDVQKMRTLTISNTGTADLHWTIYEQAPVVSPAPQTSAARPANTAPRPVITSASECAAFENYAGPEPVGYAAFCATEPAANGAPAIGAPLDPSDSAYALDIGFVSDNFVSHALNDFPGQTILGPNAQPIFAMDFDASGTTLYAIDNTMRELGTLDLGDGSFSPIAVVGGIPAADNISGLTIDPRTNEAFVSALGAGGMTLYNFDLGSAVATVIGSDASVALLIDIAVGPGGIIYGHDIGTDYIYTIDRTTGTATPVGPTGLNSNFAQGMDFDNEDGMLYAWTYQGGGSNVYGTVNLYSGTLTPLASSDPPGEFEGAVQNSGCDAGDIPWASASVTSGTTSPADSSTVEITFDSTGLSNGVYTGTLCLTSNDLQTPLIQIPLTLTVEDAMQYLPLITRH